MNPLIRKSLVAMAILSVPATLYALTDSYFVIYNYGTIGAYNGSGSGSGSGTLAVGYNNIFTGSYSLAVGNCLRGYSNCIVAGQYNKLPASGSPYLIVGNGSGSDETLRKNAFEVLSNGTVNIPGTAVITNIPAQGGISMGSFTASAP